VEFGYDEPTISYTAVYNLDHQGDVSATIMNESQKTKKQKSQK